MSYIEKKYEYLVDNSGVTAGTQKWLRPAIGDPMVVSGILSDLGLTRTVDGEKKYGLFDYDDTGTTTTPISLTSAGGYVYLTNNELGVNTNKNFPPAGVTDVWDASTQQLDFSELTLGSKVEYRIDVAFTTTSPNQKIEFAMDFAIGDPIAFPKTFFNNEYKAAGLNEETISFTHYIGSEAVKTNPAKFKARSDGNCSLIVNGWVAFVTLY